MILPFSSNRSRTSLSSNCLYCASLTPRAIFSKSMNIANLRSPFILLLSRRALSADAAHPLYVACSPAVGRFIVRANGQGHRSRGGEPSAAGPAPHGEVAGAHLRHDAALRSGPLD